MGVDSTVNVVVGFRVPVEALFDFEEHVRYSCQHYEQDPFLGERHKFCPDCGTKIHQRHYQTKELKPRMKDILDISRYEYLQDAMHNGAWAMQIGSYKLELRELVNNYHDRSDIFVAFWLLNWEPTSSDEAVAFCGNMSDLPKKELIMKTLDMYQIPYDPESYGIYMLTDWF